MIVVGCHVKSASDRVSDTTYFCTPLIQSANGSPPRDGHTPADTWYVRWPCSSAPPSCAKPAMTGPIVSGSKSAPDQPPCRNPPLVSSSGPPGACTTHRG